MNHQHRILPYHHQHHQHQHQHHHLHSTYGGSQYVTGEESRGGITQVTPVPIPTSAFTTPPSQSNLVPSPNPNDGDDDNWKMPHVITNSTTGMDTEMGSSSSSGDGQVKQPLIAESRPLHRQKFNILCLDGGGMRGLVQCQMLKAVEQITGKPIHELFDLIIGTSTGAILACMLGRELNTEAAIRQYKDVGAKLFGKKSIRGYIQMFTGEDKGVFGSQKLIELAKYTFGTNIFLDPNNPDPKTKIAVVSCELKNDTTGKYGTVIFRNYKSKLKTKDRGSDFEHIKMYEAVSASAAAPFYLDAIKLDGGKFFDGGVLHNNPTLQGIMEARAVFGYDKELTVLSLGTGNRTLEQMIAQESGSSGVGVGVADIAQAASKHHDQKQPQSNKKKGMNKNLVRLLCVCSDNNRIIKDVEKYIATSCRPGQIQYTRFSPPGLGNTNLVTGKVEEWEYLLSKTEEYVRTHHYDFRRVCMNLLRDHE